MADITVDSRVEEPSTEQGFINILVKLGHNHESRSREAQTTKESTGLQIMVPTGDLNTHL